MLLFFQLLKAILMNQKDDSELVSDKYDKAHVDACVKKRIPMQYINNCVQN